MSSTRISRGVEWYVEIVGENSAGFNQNLANYLSNDPDCANCALQAVKCSDGREHNLWSVEFSVLEMLRNNRIAQGWNFRVWRKKLPNGSIERVTVFEQVTRKKVPVGRIFRASDMLTTVATV